MKKYISLLIITAFFIIIILLMNNSNPPYINSSIGNKEYIGSCIKDIENKENLKVILVSEDITNNEYTYEIYNKNLKNKDINYNMALSTIFLKYNDENIIENLSYEFDTNNKGYDKVIECLIKSTLIDITDAGYLAIAKELKIPSSYSIIKHDQTRFVSTNLTLTLKYLKNNKYILIAK